MTNDQNKTIIYHQIIPAYRITTSVVPCWQDVIGHHHIDVEDDTYDAAVVAGAFVPGHCPLTALDEMVRVCKPGTEPRTSGWSIRSARWLETAARKPYSTEGKECVFRLAPLTSCGNSLRH